MRRLLFSLLILAPALAVAQPKTASRYEQAYREGMALFDKGQYTAAAQRFNQAQTEGQGNVFAAQARCMLAAAYLKNNQPDQAIPVLTVTLAKYADWGGASQAHRLLVEAQLKAKHWRKGIQQLVLIKGGEADKAQAAAYAGLEHCPPDTLLALDAFFPRQQPVEARLAEAGKDPKAFGSVRARAVQLEEQGRITYVGLTAKPVKTEAVGSVDVALLLPLQANAQNPGNSRNPLAEFMAGARLAQEDLAKAGQTIGLHVYDTHRNADTLSRLLTYPELKQCQLIIGPVFHGASETAEFASFNGAAMVAPLTNQIRWNTSSPAAYLAEPSIEGIAKAVFNLMPSREKVGVIYGTLPSDSMLAYAFQREAQQAGVPVPLFKRVAKNSASNLGKFILESGLDSVSVLFVPDKETLVRVQLAQALDVSKNKAMVVTYGDVLETTEVPFATYERLGVRFFYPGYIPQQPRGEGSVADRLTAILGVPPTDAAFKGYDLVYTLAPMMRSGKSSEALRLNSPIRGQFGLEYDFTASPANSVVPLYRLERGALVRE